MYTHIQIYVSTEVVGDSVKEIRLCIGLSNESNKKVIELNSIERRIYRHVRFAISLLVIFERCSLGKNRLETSMSIFH